MKILVSHVYSKYNNGDAALLSVLLSDIRRGFENTEITVLTMDKVVPEETFDGAIVKNSFMYYASDKYKNPFLRMLYSGFLIASTFLWALTQKYFGVGFPLPKNLKEVADLYKDADLIIPVGGGYLRARNSLAETIVLFFQVQPLLFASLLGKQSISYTQSVGPFGNKTQEFMAKFALRHTTGIIAREKITQKLLEEWNVKNLYLSADSGFSFKGSGMDFDIREKLSIDTQKILVGVTVRNWLSPYLQNEYERVLAKLCDYIIKKYNAYVVFIPQVTVDDHNDDDREASRKVYKWMENTTSVSVMEDQYNHHTIKSMYGHLDYLVGTRFHSVIFALTSNVPAIAVGYEYKTLGIMEDLGLSKWVVDIKKVKLDELTKMFDDLVVSRGVYLSSLSKTLPEYIEQSEKTIYFVKELYERNKKLV